MAFALVAAVAAWFYSRQCRSRLLRERFGPEYERAIRQEGNIRRGEGKYGVYGIVSAPFAWHNIAVNSAGGTRHMIATWVIRRSSLPFRHFAAVVLICMASSHLSAQEATNPNPDTGNSQVRPTAGVIKSTPAASSATRVSKEDAWQVLDSACTEDKTASRPIAVRALGLIQNNARASKLAEAALTDDNADVRLAGAAALGEMNATASIPMLRKALNDSDPTVVLAAAHSLEQMHSRSAYRVYYEVLAGDRKTHKGLIASQKAALADPKNIAKLGIHEGMGFVPYGGLGWGALKLLAKDDSSPVRAAAARSLINDPSPAASKALTEAAGDRSWVVRVAALEALAKRGNPAALDTVRLYVYDEKDAVRYTAAAAALRLAALRESAARKAETAEKRRLACKEPAR